MLRICVFCPFDNLLVIRARLPSDAEVMPAFHMCTHVSHSCRVYFNPQPTLSMKLRAQEAQLSPKKFVWDRGKNRKLDGCEQRRPCRQLTKPVSSESPAILLYATYVILHTVPKCSGILLERQACYRGNTARTRTCLPLGDGRKPGAMEAPRSPESR